MAAVKLACTCRAASATSNSHARSAMAHGTTAISPDARANTRTTTAAPPISGRAPTSGQLVAGYAASANAAPKAAPAVIKRARDALSGEIPEPPARLAPAADLPTRPQPERQDAGIARASPPGRGARRAAPGRSLARLRMARERLRRSPNRSG